MAQGQRRGPRRPDLAEIEPEPRPEALTIGFARRFAPYKRADLVMRDLDLIAKILTDADRPVQFIFAGKAHPADDQGKALLQRIFRMSQSEPFIGRVVVLEDYDINLGRHIVQGVDVWLNTPRRPLEASGTSGQKVVLNGGLNCSILDGWWAEAFDGNNGFAIGNGTSHVDQSIQDERDAQSLYDVLVHEAIPLFYERDADDLPQKWISRMKRAVRTLGWRFNADRMVMDYVRHTYVPAAGGLSCDMPGMGQIARPSRSERLCSVPQERLLRQEFRGERRPWIDGVRLQGSDLDKLAGQRLPTFERHPPDRRGPGQTVEAERTQGLHAVLEDPLGHFGIYLLEIAVGLLGPFEVRLPAFERGRHELARQPPAAWRAFRRS